jgi:hypothetical protein
MLKVSSLGAFFMVIPLCIINFIHKIYGTASSRYGMSVRKMQEKMKNRKSVFKKAIHFFAAFVVASAANVHVLARKKKRE